VRLNSQAGTEGPPVSPLYCDRPLHSGLVVLGCDECRQQMGPKFNDPHTSTARVHYELTAGLPCMHVAADHLTTSAATHIASHCLPPTEMLVTTIWHMAAGTDLGHFTSHTSHPMLTQNAFQESITDTKT